MGVCKQCERPFLKMALNISRLDRNEGASESRAMHGPTPNLAIDFERRDSFSSPLGRSSSLRRQSISLNAVINHRRALIGALFSGIGSNMSLPSCMPQDREFLPQDRKPASVSNPSREKFDTNVESHQLNMLQLTPANTAAAPSTRMDEARVKDNFKGIKNDESVTKKMNPAIVSTISTLYAKLLVVVGVAIPVSASVSHGVPASLEQGFYLYLYLASVAFVITMYTTMIRDKAVKRMLVKHAKQKGSSLFVETECKEQKAQLCAEKKADSLRHRLHRHQTQQYGSFCLRLGTVGFGAGSLVFTGLQIGAEVASGPFRAITPAARLLLVTAQMHFIFLNSKDIELTRHGALAKLGLMHMIATNLCEWLQALVVETQHEIAQLEHAHEGDVGILKTLLTDASPFLFPCTIEFSLICAVILFEMWKRVDEPILAKNESRSLHQLSIDCGSAHRGLFGGILVISATVLSLIMFFVLRKAKPKMAIEQVTGLEVAIQSVGLIASVASALKLRHLKEKNKKAPHLDATLLTAAQAGVYLHCLFGAIGGLLTRGPTWGLSLSADFLALVQSTMQTLLIKIAWRKRSTTYKKPGKELVTFLIVVNIALWIVNTLEKSRADVRPDHLKFFGVWAWTIITHVSMPLAIFFRFHSAICLFEVWKSCYKYRPPSYPAAY